MLQYMWDSLVRPDTTIGQVFVALVGATLVAIFGYLLASSRRVASRWLSKKVFQIRSPTDEKLHTIEELQRVFPPEERDPSGVLADCISASNYVNGKPQSDVAQIVLYYESEGRIQGYLSAEYYIPERTIFLWYLVNLRTISDSTVLKWPPTSSDLSLEERNERERERDSALALFRELREHDYDDHVSEYLLRALSSTCEQIKAPWRHVIAEVDARRGRDAAGKLRIFQGYISKILSPTVWQRVRSKLPLIGRRIDQSEWVFAIDVPFAMPLHDPDLLAGRSASEIKKYETKAWLIYGPRPTGTTPTLARADVLMFYDVLATSYKKGIVDYDAYIDSYFENLKTKVPEHPRLLESIGGDGVAKRRATLSRSPATSEPTPRSAAAG